jgi:microcystin-dependent protein
MITPLLPKLKDAGDTLEVDKAIIDLARQHNIDSAQLVNNIGTVPVGSIFAFGGNASPAGYMICNGAAVDRATFFELYNVIGTVFGPGNGTTTFNIPDFRGMYLRGVGTYGGSTLKATGAAYAGPAMGAVDADRLQGHFHAAPDNILTTAAGAGAAGGALGAPDATAIAGPITDGVNGTPRTSSETSPVSAGVNYIIKAMPGGDVVTASAPVVAVAPLAMNCLEGCALTNDAGDLSHDIAISKGRRRNSTNVTDMVLSAALTKQIDAAWAVGTGAGGMDTGAVGATSTYYVYLISSADGVTLVDALFSLSATAPTMPGGYTLFRMIGALRTDASANILPGTWSEGNQRFKFSVAIVARAQANDAAAARTALAIAAPPNSEAWIILSAGGGAGKYVWVREAAFTNSVPTVDNQDLIGYDSDVTQYYVILDGSSQLYYRSINGTVWGLLLRGYWLPLGAYDYV